MPKAKNSNSDSAEFGGLKGQVLWYNDRFVYVSTQPLDATHKEQLNRSNAKYIARNSLDDRNLPEKFRDTLTDELMSFPVRLRHTYDPSPSFWGWFRRPVPREVLSEPMDLSSLNRCPRNTGGEAILNPFNRQPLLAKDVIPDLSLAHKISGVIDSLAQRQLADAPEDYRFGSLPPGDLTSEDVILDKTDITPEFSASASWEATQNIEEKRQAYANTGAPTKIYWLITGQFDQKLEHHQIDFAHAGYGTKLYWLATFQYHQRSQTNAREPLNEEGLPEERESQKAKSSITSILSSLKSTLDIFSAAPTLSPTELAFEAGAVAEVNSRPINRPITLEDLGFTPFEDEFSDKANDRLWAGFELNNFSASRYSKETEESLHCEYSRDMLTYAVTVGGYKQYDLSSINEIIQESLDAGGLPRNPISGEVLTWADVTADFSLTQEARRKTLARVRRQVSWGTSFREEALTRREIAEDVKPTKDYLAELTRNDPSEEDTAMDDAAPSIAPSA